MEHEIALALPHASQNILHDWLNALPHVRFERNTRLLNIYLDTPSQNLKRTKAGLRLRFDTERSCWIQTLKTMGTFVDGVQIRQEWESILQHASSKAEAIPFLELNLFPAEAQILLQPIVNSLQAVFHTDFNREIYQYINGEDLFELAFDDGDVRLTNSLKNQVTVINELEIEYKAGKLEHMRQLALCAQTELNATPQLLSKAARGYAMMT